MGTKPRSPFPRPSERFYSRASEVVYKYSKLAEESGIEVHGAITVGNKIHAATKGKGDVTRWVGTEG